MSTILVPIDGSECSLQALREVIRQAKGAGVLEVQLLNVQPRIFPEETLVYLPAEKIDTYYYEQSSKALAPAEAELRKAGVAFASHRAVGPVAETIVQKARELSADAIVMGTHGHSGLARILLGSVASKVLHLSEVPVTLVKDKTRPDFTGRLSAT
jgi:nucleotide-binding universal stress UspA family protein